MDPLLGTLVLRPYVFALLALFLAAGRADLYYPDGGVYFGVPLSNFAGWVVVGAVSVGLYLGLAGGLQGGRLWPGVALYYVVLGFNLAVTAWIGEWALGAAGGALHAGIALTIRYVWREPGPAPGLTNRGVRRA